MNDIFSVLEEKVYSTIRNGVRYRCRVAKCNVLGDINWSNTISMLSTDGSWQDIYRDIYAKEPLSENEFFTKIVSFKNIL